MLILTAEHYAILVVMRLLRGEEFSGVTTQSPLCMKGWIIPTARQFAGDPRTQTRGDQGERTDLYMHYDAAIVAEDHDRQKEQVT